MHNDEEQDVLWDLLGQARPTGVSPYFARNVLRTLRRNNPSRDSAWSWPTLLRWVLPASGLAALLLGWTALQWNQEAQSQKEFAAEFNAAAELSPLVAVDNSTPWMDVN